MSADARTIADQLSEPFEPSEVKFKPSVVKGNRALALAYIDARLVMDRLDEVVGVDNWRDEYTVLANGEVECRLSIRFDPGEWITKADVGGQSEQPDEGDRMKAAYSDALKRAAVKFGLGRYLYRLPHSWADYDPVKKQFAAPPQLPVWAVPKKKNGSSGVVTNGKAPPPDQKSPEQVRQEVPGLVKGTDIPPPQPKPALPATGEELHRRLKDYDAKLAAKKFCPVGALLTHVAQAGLKAGYGDDIAKWSGPAIQLAVDAVGEFEKRARAATTAQTT